MEPFRKAWALPISRVLEKSSMLIGAVSLIFSAVAGQSSLPQNSTPLCPHAKRDEIDQVSVLSCNCYPPGPSPSRNRPLVSSGQIPPGLPPAEPSSLQFRCITVKSSWSSALFARQFRVETVIFLVLLPCRNCPPR